MTVQSTLEIFKVLSEIFVTPRSIIEFSGRVQCSLELLEVLSEFFVIPRSIIESSGIVQSSLELFEVLSEFFVTSRSIIESFGSTQTFPTLLASRHQLVHRLAITLCAMRCALLQKLKANKTRKKIALNSRLKIIFTFVYARCWNIIYKQVSACKFTIFVSLKLAGRQTSRPTYHNVFYSFPYSTASCPIKLIS